MSKDNTWQPIIRTSPASELMTNEQIQLRLLELDKKNIADLIPIIANGPFMLRSLNDMYRAFDRGEISDPEFQAYAYLWRNQAPRFSAELRAYDLRGGL